jgi:hypothetical protein
MLLHVVSNPGHRSVTIYTPSIVIPSGERMVFPFPQSDVQFPHELHEGKRCTIWVEQEEIARQLRERGLSGKVKLVAECDDAVGNTYKSKPYRIGVAG